MLNVASFAAPGAPLALPLALAVLLAWSVEAGAAPAPIPESRGAVNVEPFAGAASTARWRAPGMPAEDDWDDLAEAAKEEPAAQPEPSRPARPVRPDAARPQRGQPPEEPSPTMAIAKSALAWLHEKAPWAFADPESADAGDTSTSKAEPPPVIDPATGIGHDPIAPDPLHRLPGSPGPAQPVAVAAAEPGGPDFMAQPARPVAWGPTGDPVQEAIALAREVAKHPMIWLLIALIALGRLAIWLLARPTVRARQRARRHRRRRHRRRRHHR